MDTCDANEYKYIYINIYKGVQTSVCLFFHQGEDNLILSQLTNVAPQDTQGKVTAFIWTNKY